MIKNVLRVRGVDERVESGGLVYKLARLDVGAEGIPMVTSTSGADGQTDAFLELFGVSASGEPRSLLELVGTGRMPHAVARAKVQTTGASPELAAVTSRMSTSPTCVTPECLTCTKGRYAWNAARASFERAGRMAPSPCD